jgi:predicted Zn-dependent peptidase
MRHRFRAPALRALALAAALATTAAAAPPAPDPAPAPDASHEALERLRLAIHRVKLKNGLRVVMNVDRSSPTVAIAVTYDVGARNEEPGRSGFAHLFEHMMFQGSRHVPKGGHFNLISARGGTLNGTTSSDRTNYFEVLPANELALGLWLEADRMRWLAVTPENFENQRAVVQEEYRMRYENAAYMRGMLRLAELSFDKHWPYAHSVIGSMADLENASFEWVRDFHKRYYAPNNAVLTIAGDFEQDEAMRLVNQYFGGGVPTQVPAYDPAPLAPQSAERRDQVEDQNAKTPGLLYGWIIPESRTAEHYALELAAMVLTDGESSRLHRRLVLERGVLRSVSAWTSGHRGPDLFAMMATLTTRSKLPTIERELDAAVRELAEKGPSVSELQRVKNRMRTRFLFGLEANLSRATRLGEFEVFWGDARLFTRELDAYLAVTRERVQAAAAKYLTSARRNVVTVLPMAQAAPPGKPPAPSAPAGAANKGAQP